MHGSNENHDILVINDVTRPVESQMRLTSWASDDLRPVWSPDGGRSPFTRITSWPVIPDMVDRRDRGRRLRPDRGRRSCGEGRGGGRHSGRRGGPAWMPDSSRIVFVKNDRQEYNPIYVADLKEKTVMPLKTDTKMNHDVTCSVDGIIAFRAQVDQWDQIHVMKLKD